MSPTFQRVLAIALLGLVLALIWRLALLPMYREYRGDRGLIAEHREAIGRFRGIAASRDAYQAAFERAGRNPALEGALFEASSDTLAAAELQQRVKSVVESFGGSLVSTQVLDSQVEGPFTRVRVNARMTVSTPVLQQVLHALESARPYLVVEELLVLSRSGRSTRRRRQRNVSQGLDVRLRLAGFLDQSVESRPATGS